MSDAAHLLIPFASCSGEACMQARGQLALPHLDKLLARMAPVSTDEGSGNELSMPYERVLAREFAIPSDDGRIPWAASQIAQAGSEPDDHAYAFIMPCHWRVGMDRITMAHPKELALDARESQALLAAMRPYFEQDGIALHYDAPTLWLARGEVFRGLATASIDRVIGRTVDAWLPREPQARPLRRLQQEMQMLLYTLPLNEERVRGGQLPVNSFWVSGTGALGPVARPHTPAGMQVTHSLRDAALLGDWHAWASAWQQIDGREGARLLKELEHGRRVSLTLCGERSAQTWTGPAGGVLRRIAAGFSGRRAVTILEDL